MINLKTSHLGNDIIKYDVETKDILISFLNIGGAIYTLKTKDKNGTFSNIVLSLDSPEEYLKNECYYGVIIGRNSGRIAHGEFILNGKKIIIGENQKNANNHSGGNGISHRITNSMAKVVRNKAYVSFQIKLLEKNDNFPGDIEIKTTYIIFDNEVIIEYRAVSNKDTICNLTNHSYFNLNTSNKSILNHDLKNTFNSVWLLDKDNLPKNEVPSKEIFKGETKIKNLLILNKKIFYNQGGIDHPFTSNHVELSCIESGRKLKIESSYENVVLYTQNTINNYFDKINMGMAIEFQHLPNDININKDRSKTILKAGKKYFEYVRYIFNN